MWLRGRVCNTPTVQGSEGPKPGALPRDRGQRFRDSVSPPDQRKRCDAGQMPSSRTSKSRELGCYTRELGYFSNWSLHFLSLEGRVREASSIHLRFNKDGKVLTLRLVDTTGPSLPVSHPPSPLPPSQLPRATPATPLCSPHLLSQSPGQGVGAACRKFLPETSFQGCH